MDVLRLSRAIADQLGVNSDAITAYTNAVVSAQLQLVGARASELLSNSLKFAFSQEMNLDTDDAVEVVFSGGRRRGLLQVAPRGPGCLRLCGGSARSFPALCPLAARRIATVEVPRLARCLVCRLRHYQEVVENRRGWGWV